MRSVIRKPSLRKSISARTTGRVTRTVKKWSNPAYGKKGVGYIKDPKKALYNKVYNKTSYDVRYDAFSSKHSYNNSSSNSTKTSSYDEFLSPSDTLVVTNHNISALVQEHPQLLRTLYNQFVKSLIVGFFLLFVAVCLCIFGLESLLLFVTGLVLFVIAMFQLRKSKQFRSAFKDAEECMRNM